MTTTSLGRHEPNYGIVIVAASFAVAFIIARLRVDVFLRLMIFFVELFLSVRSVVTLTLATLALSFFVFMRTRKTVPAPSCSRGMYGIAVEFDMKSDVKFVVSVLIKAQGYKQSDQTILTPEINIGSW